MVLKDVLVMHNVASPDFGGDFLYHLKTHPFETAVYQDCKRIHYHQIHSCYSAYISDDLHTELYFIIQVFVLMLSVQILKFTNYLLLLFSEAKKPSTGSIFNKVGNCGKILLKNLA